MESHGILKASKSTNPVVALRRYMYSGKPIYFRVNLQMKHQEPSIFSSAPPLLHKELSDQTIFLDHDVLGLYQHKLLNGPFSMSASELGKLNYHLQICIICVCLFFSLVTSL